MIILTLAFLAQQPTRDPHMVQPERPTVATHAHTVAPGWLEIESGIEMDRNESGPNSGVVPTTLKLGLTSHAQLTLQVPGIKPSVGAFGLGDVAIGVKWRLLDDAPLLGDFAALPSLKVATGGIVSGVVACPAPPAPCPAIRRGTGTTDASLTLISSHSIGPLSLDVNVGYTRRSGDGTNAPRDATLWTMSWGGPVDGPVGWTLEVFGYPATTGPAGQDNIVAVLGGPTFAIREWLAGDAGIIAPLTGPQPRAIYAGGVVNVGRIW